MADPGDPRNARDRRGWTQDDGRNRSRDEQARRIDALNRQSNQAQFDASHPGEPWRETARGPYAPAHARPAYRPDPHFGSHGPPYAPGAEIGRERSSDSPGRPARPFGGGPQPTPRDLGQERNWGQERDWGQEHGPAHARAPRRDGAPVIGAAGGPSPKFGGADGRQEPRDAQDFGQGRPHERGHAGGTYGQQDYGRSAQRSAFREDQRYAHAPGGGAPYDRRDRPPGPAYGGGRPADDHDPDYLSWRDRQLSTSDREYAQWRSEQARRHDEDYSRWRARTRSDSGSTLDAARAGGREDRPDENRPPDGVPRRHHRGEPDR